MSFWTQDKIDQLIELKNDLSAKDLAEKLGTTKNAVLGKIHRMKLNNPVVRKKPKPRKKPELKPRDNVVKIIPDGGYKLCDLKPYQCRFPQGDAKDGNLSFCGARIAKGSYCQEHYDRCHVKQKDYVKEDKPHGEKWIW